ncbi:MAG: hypothetical protein RMM53_00010 [Bacteroidia bacterium]|nr:hypothetical protein [Bacteroidia bacterium]
MWNTLSVAATALLLAGCAFDDDERFVPRPRAVYFLCSDDEGNRTVVKLNETWQKTSEPATDFDVYKTEKSAVVWTVFGNRIRGRESATGKTEEFTFDAFTPTGLCVGKDWHVVWGDKKLCFFQSRAKNRKTVVVATDFTPRIALYNNRKFYFAADSVVAVYHETAFAPLLKHKISFRAEHADFDEMFNFVVIGRGMDGRYYSTKIGAASDVALDAGVPSAVRIVWHSRIWKSQFGSEAVLKTAGISVAGGVFPDIGRNVENLFFDFRFSRGYYRSSDSLWIYDFSPDLSSQKMVFADRWTQKIIKARFEETPTR